MRFLPSEFQIGGFKMKSLYFSIVVFFTSFSLEKLLFGQNSDYDFLANPNSVSSSEFLSELPFGGKVLVILAAIVAIYLLVFIGSALFDDKQDQKDDRPKDNSHDG